MNRKNLKTEALTDTNGILLLNKPPGITSFKVLGGIKKCLRDYSGIKVKVGHTGTLDRFAEGLLVVLTGKFTRFNQAFTDFDKSYEAGIYFGTETDTLDPEGRIIRTAEIPGIDLIRQNIPDFTGGIKQRPPIFSAVHVNGERAYKKALQGTITELPERDISIRSFTITAWEQPVLRCVIECSKGTYIRSVARDLGAACNSCGHLSALKRLTVGPFKLDDSVDPDNFAPETDLKRGRSAFELLARIKPEQFSIVDAQEDKIQMIKNGAELNSGFFKQAPSVDGRYIVFSGEDLIAYIDYNKGNYNYIFVG